MSPPVAQSFIALLAIDVGLAIFPVVAPPAACTIAIAVDEFTTEVDLAGVVRALVVASPADAFK